MTFQKPVHATKWIAVKNLSVVWAQAQRASNPKKEAEIMAEFDPDAFGTLSVSLPNGAGIYHIIDGQSRANAIRKMWDENQQVPCNVLNAEDPARAAEIFIKMNAGRAKPSSLELFVVSVTAGEPDAVEVDQIITKLGYRIEMQSRPGSMRAIASCLFVYRRYGGEALRNAIGLLNAIWGLDCNAVDASLVKGAADFLDAFGEVDKTRLVVKVNKKFTPGRLIGAAKAAKEVFGGNMPSNVKRVLLGTYNSGLRSGLLEAA